MVNIPSYPKIYNLGHRDIAKLLDGPVVVQEKVDGSQFSFGVLNGQLWMRSHHNEVYQGKDKMFNAACFKVQEIADKLHEGWVYRGEYLSKPKHNTLAYDRVPNGHIALFDIEMEAGTEKYLSHEIIAAEARALGMEVVPEFQIDEITSVDQLKELLETTSFLGGQKIEGVVIKNYKRTTIDGKTMMGKYVSESFKEVHRERWGSEENPSRGDIVQKIVEVYATKARWNKAIIHLREQGLIQDDPRDIGIILKEVNRDVREECSDAIKQSLFDAFWKDISRGVTRGFPEWYKNILTEAAFDGLSPESDGGQWDGNGDAISIDNS